MKKYPISYWCGPPREVITNEQVIKDIADAGMTIVESRYGYHTNLKVAELADKYGMKISVQDDRIYTIRKGDEGWEKILEKYVNDYKDIPNLNDYFLQDEPVEEFFPGLARIKEAMKKLDPKHKALVNMLAVPPLNGAEKYEKFIREFVEVFKPEILSFDHYNLMFRAVDRITDKPEADISEESRVANGWVEKVFERVDRPSYYDNLEIIREIAAEENIPWKAILQVVEHWDFRHVNESEMRWEVFAALAYGADEIDYFTYATPPGRAEGWDYHHAMIHLDGTKDSRYYMVQRINKDLALLGAQVMDAESEAVFHIGFAKGDTHVKYFHQYKDFTDVWAEKIILGFFTNGNVILANKDHDNPQYIAFKCEHQPQWLNKVTGEWQDMVKADDGRYHLLLAPGDGEMIR